MRAVLLLRSAIEGPSVDSRVESPVEAESALEMPGMKAFIDRREDGRTCRPTTGCITATALVIVAICNVVFAVGMILAAYYSLKSYDILVTLSNDEAVSNGARASILDSAAILGNVRKVMEEPDEENGSQIETIAAGSRQLIRSATQVVKQIDLEAVHDFTTWLGTREARDKVFALANRGLEDLETFEGYVNMGVDFLKRHNILDTDR